MSAFIEGSQALASGAQDIVITFPADTFASVPDLVIPVIENLVDQNTETLWASLVAKTKDNFTVHLSGPTNSANYVLRYFAGSNSDVFGAISRTGKMVSAYDALLVGLLDTDYMMWVHTANGITQTVRVPLATLKSMFTLRATTIPDSPTADGIVGQVVISPKFIYTYDGVLWGQTPRATTNWQSE